MNDHAALFAILCLIYISDCFLWVDSNSLAFVSRSGKRWIEKRPGVLTLASKGGVLYLNPLPPLGKVMRSQILPFCVSPHGVCSAAGQPPALDGFDGASVDTVNFDAILKVSVSDKWLLLNNKKFRSFSVRQQAESACILIDKLRRTAANERSHVLVQWLTVRFDMDAAKERLDSCLNKISRLTFLANALFLYSFVLSPVLMLIFKQTELLIWIALGMFIIAGRVTLCYYQLHKILYPDLPGERIGNVIKMLMCPPVSIRAGDLITQNLLVNYHPLLVARLLFSEKQFARFAGNWLRQVTYADTEQTAGLAGSDIVRWYQKTLIGLTVDQLALKDDQIEAMLGAPAPDDSDVRAYCPRCHAQFLLDGGHCPDCPGVGLIRFDQTKALKKLKDNACRTNQP